jgi:phosphoadenosine phosphosulfate reductase
MTLPNFSEIATALNATLSALPLRERLAVIAHEAKDELTGKRIFTTSFGLEDQVLTHFIFGAKLPIEVMTLDTGRLFPETYELWAKTEAHYGVRIKAVYPDAEQLETLISTQGINGFYDSVDKRKACCDVRKTAPLARALEGAHIWLTGLRGDQSANRSNFHLAEVDTARSLIKVNPLIDHTREQLVALTQQHHIPINALHAKGFPSIGCAPCTRAIEEWEEERAGRWWWEQDNKKECGLHVGSDGRLVRTGNMT